MRPINNAPVNTDMLLPTHHVRHEGTPAQPAVHPSAGSAHAREIGPITKEQDLTNRVEAITASLMGMFEFHITEDNREAMQSLINDRATRLAADGEDAKSFEKVMSWGNSLDRPARLAVGATRSAAFCTASLTQDFAPALKQIGPNADTTNLAKSAMSAGMDGLAGDLVKRATSDTQWIAAEHDDLEPVMQAALEKVKPGLARKALEASLSYQTFFIRNTVILGAKTAVAATLGPEAAAKTDAIASGVGSLIAGAFAVEVQHALNKREHRVGPEYFLARKDWHERYTALKNYRAADAAAGLGRRVARLPVDVAQDGLPAVRSQLTAGSLMTAGVLTGGLYGIGKAATAAASRATEAGCSPTAIAAAGKAAVTGTMVPVVAAWVSTAVAGQQLVDNASKKVDKLLGRPAHMAQTQGSIPVPEGPAAESEDEFFDAQSHFSDAEHIV